MYMPVNISYAQITWTENHSFAGLAKCGTSQLEKLTDGGCTKTSVYLMSTGLGADRIVEGAVSVQLCLPVCLLLEGILSIIIRVLIPPPHTKKRKISEWFLLPQSSA